ncbi:hypothetical protein PS2_001872 [Malus domestica]
MSSTQAVSPQVWIADSGATNHMTADFNNLTLATPYPTSETVQTANGEGLRVSHIGSTILKPHIHPIKLNSILYDKATRMILFKGICSKRLYLIPSLASHHSTTQKLILQPKAFLGQLVTSIIWHNRLGHSSNPIVS